jgi:hypothetical protein
MKNAETVGVIFDRKMKQLEAAGKVPMVPNSAHEMLKVLIPTARKCRFNEYISDYGPRFQSIAAVFYKQLAPISLIQRHYDGDFMDMADESYMAMRRIGQKRLGVAILYRVSRDVVKLSAHIAYRDKDYCDIFRVPASNDEEQEKNANKPMAIAFWVVNALKELYGIKTPRSKLFNMAFYFACKFVDIIKGLQNHSNKHFPHVVPKAGFHACVALHMQEMILDLVMQIASKVADPVLRERILGDLVWYRDGHLAKWKAEIEQESESMKNLCSRYPCCEQEVDADR